MTSLNERVATMQIGAQNRLTALLVALAEAAQCESFRAIKPNDRGGYDVETVKITLDESQLTDSEREEIESDGMLITTLRSQLDHMGNVLDTLFATVRDAVAIDIYLPRTVHDAVTQLLAAEAEYAERTVAYLSALEDWQQLDMTSGRTRVQCSKELQAGGMSATAADKAASDHPTYTAHKDALLAAAIAKDEATAEREIAYARMRNAREILRAMIESPEQRNVEPLDDNRLQLLESANASLRSQVQSLEEQRDESARFIRDVASTLVGPDGKRPPLVELQLAQQRYISLADSMSPIADLRAASDVGAKQQTYCVGGKSREPVHVFPNGDDHTALCGAMTWEETQIKGRGIFTAAQLLGMGQHCNACEQKLVAAAF